MQMRKATMEKAKAKTQRRKGAKKAKAVRRYSLRSCAAGHLWCVPCGNLRYAHPLGQSAECVKGVLFFFTFDL